MKNKRGGKKGQNKKQPKTNTRDPQISEKFKQYKKKKRETKKNQICKRCKKIEQTQRDNKLPTKTEKQREKYINM